MRIARLLGLWVLASLVGLGLTYAAQAALTPSDRDWAMRQKGIVYFVHTRTPAVALTFDDGPNPADTPRVLAALRSAGAHATFFVLGDAVRRYPDLLRRIIAQGDEVGLHSFSHPDMRRLSPGAMAEQIGGTAAIVAQVAAVRPTLFRFPYFAHTPAAVRVVRDLGYTVVEASIDPKDWSHPGVAAIVRRATAGLRPGDILLLHDGGGQAQTVAALPQILSVLGERGLRCVTVSELLKLGPPSYEPPAGDSPARSSATTGR